LLAPPRRIVAEWDGAAAAVQAAGAAARQTLVVGFHTRIGRGLVPAIGAALEERLPGWRLRFRQVPWGDPAVGLHDGTVDVAVAWLPVAGPGIAHRVAATEPRWVALPAAHPLAGRDAVPFAELAVEPFVALPASAGPMREFWLATDHRSTPALVAAEASTADEAFEAVASGVGVALLAAGNAAIYRRDRRRAVRVVTDTCCRCVAADQPSAAPG
jgi:DNA-binding transcriptional LysR family regulator